MRKGERTKKMIIEKTSKLMNTQGYLATSISDVMKETGLEAEVFKKKNGDEQISPTTPASPKRHLDE